MKYQGGNYQDYQQQRAAHQQYLQQYRQTILSYLEKQLARHDITPNKKIELQKIYDTLEVQITYIERLQGAVIAIKETTKEHRGKDGFLKDCKAKLFKPASYRDISKLFDEKNELKSYKQNKMC